MFTIEQNILTYISFDDIHNGVLTINGSDDLRFIGRSVFGNSIGIDSRILQAVRKIIIRNVDEIWVTAFAKLPNLEEVIIENERATKPTKICQDAFSINPNLKKISIHGQDFELEGCFQSCEKVTDINISARKITNKNMPFEKSGTSKTTVYLNAEIESGDYAFAPNATIVSARSRG